MPAFVIAAAIRARRNQKLTVSQFLKVYEGSEDKVELIDGEVWLIAVGTLRHADVAINIIVALFMKLRGGRFRPYNSGAGVFLDIANMRYPDVSLTCDPRDPDQDHAHSQLLHHPCAIFEVLSPSTAGDDSGWKIEQYKRRLASLRMAALVDPVEETIRGYVRDADGPWRDFELARGHDLIIAEPAITLTAAEIFAA